MAITVIHADPEHAEIIARFNQEMALETENKVLDRDIIYPGVMTMLQDAALGFYLVAIKDNTVVGCLGVTYEWSDWRNGLFWWIQSVYVASEWRRKGVYRALYSYIYQQASSDNTIGGIRLYVDRDNTVAQQTYSSLGMAKSHYEMYEIDFLL